VSDAPEKSEFRKLLDVQRVEREEEKFRRTVLTGLERIEVDVALVREKLAELLVSRQKGEREFASVRQYLTWVLMLIVGGAIANWISYNA
jgi:ubiquinone biosynthesis protein COQ9